MNRHETFAFATLPALGLPNLNPSYDWRVGQLELKKNLLKYAGTKDWPIAEDLIVSINATLAKGIDPNIALRKQFPELKYWKDHPYAGLV